MWANFWLVASGTTREILQSSRGMKVHCIDIFSVGIVVSKMPMTCQINMLRDRGRYVVVAGRAHQSLEPSKQMCFDTRRHATSVSSQTSTPVSLRSHTPTNRLTRAQIRGSLRNYWMIVSPREAPERSSMKPRPPCPWQRRIIMSLVVRARARVDCSACPRAAGQSNMIWNNAWTTGSLMNARVPTCFCILAELW